MFSCAARVPEYSVNGPAEDVAGFRSEVLVQFCGITQHVIMFSCSAKLLKYFANSRAKHVADLRSEILGYWLIG